MKSLLEFFSGRRLFFMALGVVAYFVFLILNWYVLHLSSTLLRFFGEILTLPLLFLVQPTLLIFSIFHCIKDRFRIKTYSFWSFFILLISNLFVLGTYIIAKIN